MFIVTEATTIGDPAAAAGGAGARAFLLA